MNFKVFLSSVLILFFTTGGHSAEKTKVDKDLQLIEGDYEVVPPGDNEEKCTPGHFKVVTREQTQVVYLGARILFGDINKGPIESITETKCHEKYVATTSRVNNQGLLTCDVQTVCAWGSYINHVEVKFMPNSIEYSEKRSSENEKKIKSFDLTCTFVRTIKASPPSTP